MPSPQKKTSPKPVVRRRRRKVRTVKSAVAKAATQLSAPKTSRLVSSYTAALKRAAKTGNSVRMIVHIDPVKDQPRIDIEDAPVPDALDDALKAARVRGTVRVAEILSGEDMLSADAFAVEIGATRETVHKKRRRHEVLGLEGPKRGVRFPRWQLSLSGELIPHLPELFEALGERSWTVYQFLLEKHDELKGSTALEAIRAGQIEDVLATAESIGRGSFS